MAIRLGVVAAMQTRSNNRVLGGLFLRSRAVAGAIPTGARQRGSRAVGGEFSPMGCFFGDLGWLALLFDGKPSQYLCRLLQAKLGKAAEIGVKRERRFLQTALDR